MIARKDVFQSHRSVHRFVAVDALKPASKQDWPSQRRLIPRAGIEYVADSSRFIANPIRELGRMAKKRVPIQETIWALPVTRPADLLPSGSAPGPVLQGPGNRHRRPG